MNRKHPATLSFWITRLRRSSLYPPLTTKTKTKCRPLQRLTTAVHKVSRGDKFPKLRDVFLFLLFVGVFSIGEFLWNFNCTSRRGSNNNNDAKCLICTIKLANGSQKFSKFTRPLTYCAINHTAPNLRGVATANGVNSRCRK